MSLVLASDHACVDRGLVPLSIKVHHLECLILATFLGRARGLLFRECMLERCAVALLPCRAVHTFGMHGAIDLAFLDVRGVVLEIHELLQPMRVLRARFKSTVTTLELAAGQLSARRIKEGDQCILREGTMT